MSLVATTIRPFSLVKRIRYGRHIVGDEIDREEIEEVGVVVVLDDPGWEIRLSFILPRFIALSCLLVLLLIEEGEVAETGVMVLLSEVLGENVFDEEALA